MTTAVMKFSALGDIAMALPFLRALENAPCIISSPIGKEFLQDEFSDFIVMENKSLSAHLKIIRDIRRRNFEDLIDLQGNDRSRFISICSGATIHNGYDPKRGRYSELAKKIKERAKQRLKFIPTPRDYIVFNTGSSAKWASKRPPAWKWKEFAEKVNERFGLPIKLTGSAEEIPYVSALANELPENVEIVAGQTSLTELKALLKGAFLTVSTDSAAMHISAVEGTPTVGIFGATSWQAIGYVPWGVALYDRTFYPDGIPPKRSRTEALNYYNHIDLTEGLDALKDYLI